MTDKSPIAVVGAGIAGLTCAERLSEAGYTVRLFDKGRGPGGRMSTRRIDTPAGEASFDHGAAFFTAVDSAFRRRVDAWIDDGHVAPWPEAGPTAFVGAPSMNAPIKALAAALDVQWLARVTALARRPRGWMLELAGGEGAQEGPFAAVIVAVPPEQATPLLTDHSFDLAVYSAIAQSTPVWTTMLAFEAPVPAAAACLEGCDILERAVRETSKPGRSPIECWTLQATTEWSTRRLSSSATDVSAELTAAFASRFDAPLPATIAQQSHRWLYARPAKPTLGTMWHANAALGLCGDWVLGDGVEAAWRSGVKLAERIISLSASAFEPDDQRPAVQDR